MSKRSAERRVRAALVLLASAACVSYDPAGPPVPPVDGTWQARFVVSFDNQLELRTDTLEGQLRLRDTRYRGRFTGTYHIGPDSGAFGGVIRPEAILIVDEFGSSLTPVADVDTLRRLYRWCDFTRLGTGGLAGVLQGDTLTADGQASLPCFYSQYDREVEIPTTLTIDARAVR